MGLDMYLYLRKEEYESVNDWDGIDKTIYPKELSQFETNIKRRNFASKTIKEDYQVGYWRKANAIHKWFVDNCGEGEDKCQVMYVSLGQLQQLRENIEEVLKQHSKNKELLPTQEGFFFGTTDYDDYYYEELVYTKQLIDKVVDFISSDSGKDYDVIYQASW